MRRIALLPVAALLGACAAPADKAPVAAAADPAPVALTDALAVTDAADGVIRVAGAAADDDALAAHHCLAAKHARTSGANALEWVGGIAKRDEVGDGVSADLVYQSAARAGRATGLPPAEGRAAPVADWLIYCDEAGIPREGEA